MDNILLTIFILITIVIGGVLIWLIQGYNNLKHEHRVLSESLERNNKDVAGLCSAAVCIDTQISDINQQLNDIAEKLSDFEQQQEISNPYHTAIQRVRNGGDVAELVRQCGLSKEEAALLIRLHGNGMASM